MEFILIAFTAFAFVAILAIGCVALGKCYEAEQDDSDFYADLRGDIDGRPDEFE